MTIFICTKEDFEMSGTYYKASEGYAILKLYKQNTMWRRREKTNSIFFSKLKRTESGGLEASNESQ